MRRSAMLLLLLGPPGMAAGMPSAFSAGPICPDAPRFNREFPSAARGEPAAGARFELDRLRERAYPLAPDDPGFRRILAVAASAPARVRREPADSRPRWLFLGPSELRHEVTPFTPLPKNFSGRATAIAIARECSISFCRLWLGTAGGGIWRTDHALSVRPDWEHLERGLSINTVGSLALDPNDPTSRTIYAGTGEANFTYTSGAGAGIYRSVDGGDSWTRVPTGTDAGSGPLDFTASRGVARVAIEPGSPSTIYAATAYALQGMTAVRGGQSVFTGQAQAPVGLYRTRDGGATWSLLWAPPVPGDPPAPGIPPGGIERMEGVRDVQLDPLDPATVWITAFNHGVLRSSPAIEGGDPAFRPVFVPEGAGQDGSLAAIALTVQDGHTRVYAGNGVSDPEFQGVYRMDDGSAPASVLVLDGPSGPFNGAAWTRLTSSDPAQPGYTSYDYCGRQCSYDHVLAVPEGRPDTLFVGGLAADAAGDPVLVSADAGRSFSSFGADVQEPPGILHSDVHAIAFDPADPAVVFVASDGGIARSGPERSDGSSLCGSDYLGYAPDDPGLAVCARMRAEVPSELHFLNAGLSTLQFFSVAADPRDPLGRLMGGTQDNSTVGFDRSRDPDAWEPVFPVGDGTAALAFHPTDARIRFTSFQDRNFFTNFEGADGGLSSWVWTSGPIAASGEQTSLSDQFTGRQFLTLDPVHPDTQFTGFQRVWRTRRNGGDPAFLEANCTLFRVVADLKDRCGDWEPLGTSLTDPSWGDRAGGIIVAAARPAGDSGTLWAATSTGRVFVSGNADSVDPGTVSFARVDSGGAAPGRFVSAIVVSAQDPNRVWIAYSGFSALTPDRPGHLFRVTWDPASHTSEWSPADADWEDRPIDHLVSDDSTGDLYAASDSGVSVLRAGAARWEPAGLGLPEVLTPYLQIVPEKRLLLAATHGRGIWYLTLP